LSTIDVGTLEINTRPIECGDDCFSRLRGGGQHRREGEDLSGLKCQKRERTSRGSEKVRKRVESAEVSAIEETRTELLQERKEESKACNCRCVAEGESAPIGSEKLGLR
jgi:hypothetical protein